MILYRHRLSDRCETTGELPDGTEITFIEKPWNNNEPNDSCIPTGDYFFVRDHTGRHQWWSILDVPDRTFIEIHEGYKPEHSLGCVVTSRANLDKMLEFYNEDGVKYPLKIVDAG